MTQGRYKGRGVATVALALLLQTAVVALALPAAPTLGPLRRLLATAPLTFAAFLVLDIYALFLLVSVRRAAKRGEWDAALDALDMAALALLASAVCLGFPQPRGAAWRICLVRCRHWLRLRCGRITR